MNTPKGWQCPCCLVVYAPSVMKCECAKVEAKKPTPKIGLAEFEKLAEEMGKAALKKERPFYPPPPPMELAPPTTRIGPQCRGQTPTHFDSTGYDH